jgi:hypothetical protein
MLIAAIPIAVTSMPNHSGFKGGANQHLASQQQPFSASLTNNSAPLFGTPSPVNGSTDAPLNLTWSIPIHDTEGDGFNWTVQCSNEQMSSGTNASNGTKSLQLSNLTYLTIYTVWVNATDPNGSGNYTRAWFTFTTLRENLPPIFGIPTPVNGSTNTALNLTWSIPISDPDGDRFDYKIQCSNGQSKVRVNMSNGTKTLVLTNLTFATRYTIWVNATDTNGSGHYTRAWFTFTTKNQNQTQIMIAASPNILWPPNHKMRTVKITGSVSGMSSGMTLTFTVADEYHLVEPSLTGFNQTIQLQAWREGQDKNGRIYTITATITDAHGVVATASTVVLVPHDQGH